MASEMISSGSLSNTLFVHEVIKMADNSVRKYIGFFIFIIFIIIILTKHTTMISLIQWKLFVVADNTVRLPRSASPGRRQIFSVDQTSANWSQRYKSSIY